MGGATVEGLIKGKQFKNEDITVSDPSQAVVEKFSKMGVSVTTDNKLAADSADIVCVVVKPWLVERVLKDIRPELDPKKQILIVIAAGVSSESIKEWLGEQCPPLFLVIPNIASAERASMTFIVPIGAAEDHIKTVVGIFDEMGNTLITDSSTWPLALPSPLVASPMPCAISVLLPKAVWNWASRPTTRRPS